MSSILEKNCEEDEEALDLSVVPEDSRHIVHLDLDTFFVSVERLLNSRLNSRLINKPVTIGGCWTVAWWLPEILYDLKYIQ